MGATCSVQSHGPPYAPRTTQPSHRTRVSDRTMLGTLPARWLRGAFALGKEEPRLHEPGSYSTPNAKPDSGTTSWRYSQALAVRKLPTPAETETCFLLTSPLE